jgi:hypothetical protein
MTLMQAQLQGCRLLCFMCPVSNKVMKLAAILYVDDCDLLHIDMGSER